MKRKNREEKKSFARPLLLSLLVRSRHWATNALCVCVCVVAVIEDRKALDEVKKKKGEKTETNMQSKAIEGVPRRAHAFSCTVRS
jgi:hypothetical protein